MKIELKSKFHLVISMQNDKLTPNLTTKCVFLRQNVAFLRFGGSAELTEHSAEHVRPDLTEGSAEPFGFGRTPV